MRTRSSMFIMSLLAAAALYAASAGAATTPASTDTLSGPGWSLAPGAPCTEDSITLTVMGFYDTPCDSFIGVEKLDPLHVRVRALVRDGYACFVAPIPYPIRVPLGRLPAGPKTLDIEYETVHLAEDGSLTSEFRHTPVNFVVTADCPTSPGPMPWVRQIYTKPEIPCAQQPTSLVMEGLFPDGCGKVIGQSPPGAPIELTIKVATGMDTACTLAQVPWRVEFPLGSLAAGHQEVAITLHVITRDPVIPGGLIRTTYHGTHGFVVADSCDTLPPPGPLPYVTSILVTRPRPCDLGPPCPRDSALVLVNGWFPSPCYSFQSIELIESPVMSPLPAPPIVRITVDNNACILQICPAVPTYWSAAIKLPPLPARGYNLGVELAEVTCADSYPPGRLFSTNVPFSVIDSCAAPSPCLVAGFSRASSIPTCHATVSPSQPAQLTFFGAATVALAGLQGEFRLEPPGLRITGIEAIGPAAGMILNWTETADGARFVLFAQSGAPIPPLPIRDTMHPARDDWPLLRITAAAMPGVDGLPDRTFLTALNLLGSDIDGNGVRPCAPEPCGPDDPPYPGADPRYAPPMAVICVEHACDFNADGVEDVRDLVTMVHCVTGEGPCPPDGGIAFDCDADQVLTVADVLCCARHILGRPPCIDCTPDSVRSEPRVAFSFGAPVETATGVDLPLHVAGSDRLGAAMLTLGAPLDRYDVTGFDGGASTQWLTLHQVHEGRLMLGMIDAQGPNRRAVPGSLDLTLHLNLKPGQSPGGEVTTVAGEFSGTDGAMVMVGQGSPSQVLPGPTRVELSGNRPNPFSAETRFTLQLTEAAEVVVGIYDLRGRAVATVFRGRLPSGPQEFRWDGRSDDGSRAANGVYFYRVATGGKTLARKLILMRGN